MNVETDPLAAERQFFAALLAGSSEALVQLLTDDFILIAVMDGAEVTKSALLVAIDSGQLKFEAIQPADTRLRLYQATAIITGRTQMTGRLGEAPFSVRSRYTHVFVQQQGRWRLASAQGTQIAAA